MSYWDSFNPSLEFRCIELLLYEKSTYTKLKCWWTFRVPFLIRLSLALLSFPLMFQSIQFSPFSQNSSRHKQNSKGEKCRNWKSCITTNPHCWKCSCLVYWNGNTSGCVVSIFSIKYFFSAWIFKRTENIFFKTIKYWKCK